MSKMSKVDLEGASPEAGQDIFLDLLGPLRLRDAAGTELTPRGRKSQGLLALLGLSPGLRRSRTWLQDKLWSDRAPVQASGSLRQCLTEIRTSLGRHVDCLRTDRGWVALDPERVHVIADRDRPSARDLEFLEGLDIRDAEFEHWIRDQRMHHSDRHGRGVEDLFETDDLADCPDFPRAPTVGLLPLRASSEAELACSDVMLNLLAGHLLLDADVDVIDLRDEPCPRRSPKAAKEPDWLLKLTSSALGSRVRFTVALSDLGANRIHWADTAVFAVSEFYAEDSLAVGAFAERAAGVVRGRLARSAARAASQGATARPYHRLIGARIPAGARPV
ncbi:MAG: hypothetical protein U1E59_16645 [Amaricoccus sp.]